MANTSPENTTTAVSKASETIKTRGDLDQKFPDLIEALKKPAERTYDYTRQDTVQPVVTKQTIIMPSEGLETIKQFDPSTSPAGIAPSINRAYYAVKNCLYLWNYVQRKMIVHEEEDDIVGVAFVAPKLGIFSAEINQLLIISTTREVKIIATSYTPETDLRVYQTDMSTNTAGVNMKTIVGTKFGRVFMLGSDGNVWELDYRSQEGWFAGRCSKRLHTSGSSFNFLFAAVRDPITQIVVNESGTVLYQLTEGSTISVTDLGADGQSFNTVCNYTKALEVARNSDTSSHFLDPKAFKIVSINPTLPTESKQYHLVAVLSSGYRLYFTHRSNSLNGDSPNSLVLEHYRLPNTENVKPTDHFSHVIYKDGLFIGVKNQHEKPTEDKIITYCPDLGRLTNPVNLANSNFEFAEFDNEINVPGKIISIVEAPSSTPYHINELTASYEQPGRTFLALTTYGLAVLVKQRPIDMLFRLLSRTNQDTAARLHDFHSFFSHFGYINSVSLCLGLICCPFSTTTSGTLNTVEPIPSVVISGAKTLLGTLGQAPSALNNQYTSRHDGLALFISRVINPIWEKVVFKASTNDASAIYSCTIPAAELHRTQEVLKKLVLLMQQNPNEFGTSANKPEEASLKDIQAFVSYMSEAISFIIYLIKTDISTIIKSVKPQSQETCKTITLKRLLTTADGRSLASDLSYALIEYTYSKFNNTNYVIDVLTQYCKSFCGANDVLLYKATKQIYSARSATNTTQAKAILIESLNTLSKIALHIPADKAAEISQDFAFQGYHVYGVKLALDCAKTRDPNNSTNAFIEAGCPPNDPRAQTFKNKQPFYDIVFDLLYNVISKGSVGDATTHTYRKEIFDVAFGFSDKAFAYYMYEKFISKNIGHELIKESPPYLEEFLTRKPFSYERLTLLADYYKMNERYEEAAKTYYTLATATDDIKVRMDNLVSASLCANSVTAPAKQYDMYHLNEAIKQNLEEARQQQTIPAQ